MIRHPGRNGVAFTEADDGDQTLPANRTAVSSLLGIPDQWATVNQVHGADVVKVEQPGSAGEADAIWTANTGLPIAVLTADCYGVVVGGVTAVGVAHAGWRGTLAGVVESLHDAMSAEGHPPEWTAIGPGIRSCCFEVGPEVSSQFEGQESTTSWGTTSVDLVGSIVDRTPNASIWALDSCTASDDGWFSFRKTGTGERLAALAWLP